VKGIKGGSGKGNGVRLALGHRPRKEHDKKEIGSKGKKKKT